FLQLPSPSMQVDQSPRRDLLPLGELRRLPGLVEEEDVEVSRAVVERQRHHRLALASEPLVNVLDPSDHGGHLTTAELPDRRYPGPVDVRSRVVLQELADRPDVERLGQD